MAKILVIDNYDSFVYNIVQYLAQIGADVQIVRNDDAFFDQPKWWEKFDGLLISPGPGTPEDAGVCVQVVKNLAGKIPIFGVCLGLQAIGVAFGASVGPASELLHGKVSAITNDGHGIFTNLPKRFNVTRYHSLAIQPETMPDELEITAVTDSEVIMAIRHRNLAVEAVQFHPESVLTQYGYQMLANWLVACADLDAPTRAKELAVLASDDVQLKQ